MGRSSYKFWSAEENRERLGSSKDSHNKKVTIFRAHGEGTEISISETNLTGNDMR